jgi:hypothetical protein
VCAVLVSCLSCMLLSSDVRCMRSEAKPVGAVVHMHTNISEFTGSRFELPVLRDGDRTRPRMPLPREYGAETMNRPGF